MGMGISSGFDMCGSRVHGEAKNEQQMTLSCFAKSRKAWPKMQIQEKKMLLTHSFLELTPFPATLGSLWASFTQESCISFQL